MFKDFAENLCRSLIENGYYTVSPKGGAEITDNTPFIMLARNLSPVLYTVTIINAGAVGENMITSVAEPVNMSMERSLAELRCSYAICLNLLAAPKDPIIFKSYVDKKDNIPGGKINQCWWLADLENKKLLFGKNQPTKIMELDEIIKNVLVRRGGKTESNSGSSFHIEKIEKESLIKGAVPVKSRSCTVTYSLILINLLVWAYVTFTGSQDYFFGLFANNSDKVLNYGEYYRLITCMFFHTTIMHVGYNCLTIYIFGRICEKYMGKSRYVLIYFLSGICGSAASVIFTKGISVGASGAIFGILGAITAFNMNSKKDLEGMGYFTILMFTIAGILMGFGDTGVDNFAHLGGIISGFLISMVFTKFFNGKKQ